MLPSTDQDYKVTMTRLRVFTALLVTAIQALLSKKSEEGAKQAIKQAIIELLTVV